MPHISLVPRELDEQYPSMRAPAADRKEDVPKDEGDTVFKHGMQIAEGTRAAMRFNGRTRYRAAAVQDDGNEDAIGRACGYRRLDALRPSRTSHVVAGRVCGYRRLDALRPSRTSHVAATDFVGLLCEPMSSVAGPRAAVPRDTSHGEGRPWHPPARSRSAAWDGSGISGGKPGL